MPLPTLSNTGIRDNYHCGKVGDYLREKLQNGTELSVVSAYFTIFAHHALKEKLEAVEHVRFLFGEPRFITSLDPEKTDPKSFKIEDDTLSLSNRLTQRAAAKACANWIKRKVDIRSIAQANLLHGKLYHLQNGPLADALLGSSNFTVSGLGYGNTPNVELNLEVDSRRDLVALRAWFDKLWNDTALTCDVKAEVLEYLSRLYRDHSPEFIYYKTLFHIFESLLTDRTAEERQLEKTSLYESQIWNALYDFQKDGAKGAINKILTHNGCILADSVGLGKTFEALAVIKYFEGRNNRVLVLCPKKLRENWTVYHRNDTLNPFLRDRFDFDVLSHTDLGRTSGQVGKLDLSRIDWSAYGLVVIDESHNFRNNTAGRRDESGEIIRKSRYACLLEDVLKAGIKSKVLLLSATPVNNTLRDLRNQLYLVSEGDDDAFGTIGVDSLEQTLKVAQQQFSLWAKKPSTQRTTRSLLDGLSSGFFTLLDQLTIARSRKHIQRYYKDSLAQIGGFPKREKPVSCSPDIDIKGRFMSYDKLSQEIDGYRLSLYNPSGFVHKEYKSLYEKSAAGGHFNQAGRERLLIGMMKVGFLKRLESSVYSFARTMERVEEKISELEKRIHDFKRKTVALPTAHPGELNLDIDTGELPLEFSEDDDDTDAFEVGKRLKYQLAHLNLDDWLEKLHQDKQQIFTLSSQAKAVTPDDDAKLAELKQLLTEKLTRPTITKDGCENRKVLIFTAFSDTATYLYNSLRAWVRREFGVHLALVTGGAGNQSTFDGTDFNHILTHFSPRSKNRDKQPNLPQEGCIDILIATDCISEGQNLQDCDYLINYDIHWNPVRIIQRFGRIDRIGSINKSVKLVNFWPTPNLDKYISLKSRVEARMALVDISATVEDNPLANEDMEELVKSDLHYRDKQLLRLKDEILDLEDLQDEGVSLTEFTLDDFRSDLLRYLEANKAALQKAPLGLHTVVPADPPGKACQPGVVFCLRQKNSPAAGFGASENAPTTINPLQPHYLVYVHSDGNVRLTFAQPKQVLEALRHLCAGHDAPFRAICAAFDRETSDGTDMTHYNKLLERAIASIATTFRRRSGAALLNSRNALLVPQAEQPTERPDDFEFITWVVIK